MGFPTLAEVDDVYKCNRLLTVQAQFVSFPALGYFNSVLNSFSRDLADDYDEEYWRTFIRPLKYYRFDIAAAPLLQSTLEVRSASLYRVLEQHLADCQRVYPSRVRGATEVLEAFYRLSQEKQDHLLQAVASLQLARNQKDRGTAILIKESRLVQEATAAIHTLPKARNWTVIHPRNLREITTFRRLIVIGRPGWFPGHVFAASRAPKIIVISYDWVHVNWRSTPAFVNPVKRRRGRKSPRIAHTPPADAMMAQDMEPPTINVERVMKAANREFGSSDEDEYVEARLLILESGKGVFVEAEGDARVFVIDLEEEAKNRVKSIPHHQLEPSMYVLFRTSGSRDYVVPVANRIMGNKAEDLRDMQKTWKARLRLAVKKYGSHNTIRRLKAAGSTIANYQNLRNWMAERSIRTQNQQDFNAIMRVVGLDKAQDEYWDAMSAIRKAHVHAGKRIRSLLLREVNRSDLVELERNGFMHFTLEDRDAGTLAAFRVNAIEPRTVQVLPGRIDTPFDLEEA